jgi:hypothetical protein
LMFRGWSKISGHCSEVVVNKGSTVCVIHSFFFHFVTLATLPNVPRIFFKETKPL